MNTLVKFLVISTAMTAITSCSSDSVDERFQQALTSAQTESARCRDEYPLDKTHIIQRTKCLNKSSELVRPFAAYPDISDATAAYNLMLAEQFRDGKISEGELLAKETERRSQGIAEAERRGLANRAVNAQERPHSVVVYPMNNTMPVFRAPCLMGPRGPTC